MNSWLTEFQNELLARGFHPEHVARIVHLYETGHPCKAKRLIRPICGARKKTGELCLGHPVPGRRRCKFHGGLAFGPTTAEGRQRITDGLRRYWDEWHALPPSERPTRGPQSPEARQRVTDGLRAYWERERERRRIAKLAAELPEELR